MKTLLPVLLIALHLSGYNVLAQTAEIENLIKAIDEKEGYEKIVACSELSFLYFQHDPAKGIYFGQKALRLADSLKRPDAKSKAWNNLGLNFLSLAKHDSARIAFLNALQFAHEFNDTLQKADAFNRLGVVYEKLPKLDSALYAFHEALKLYKQLGNNERAGVASENIGTIHLHRGEETSALTWLLEAKALFEVADAMHRLPSVYVRLGSIYSEDGNFTEAEKWHLRAIELAAEQENHQYQGIGINALGVMYKNQGRYEEAVKKYLEAVALGEKIRNPFLLSAVYGNLGNAYSRLGEHRNALDYHRQSLDVSKKLNMPLEVAKSQSNMGSAYNSLGDYSNAKACFEKALPVFIETGTWSMLLSAYSGLITANTGLKAYEDAVKYFKEYITIKDSLNRVERNTALDSLKVRFNTEQTLRKNIMLAQNNEILQKTNALNRTIMFSASILSLLLLGFIVVIVRNRQIIKKANLLLASRNEEISAKAEELGVKNKQLLEFSQYKDSMNSFLVHDLKNPLNYIINLEPDQLSHQQAEGVRQSGRQMLNLVSSLLDISRHENRMMKLELKDTSLVQAINQAFNETSYLARQKNIKIVPGIQYDFIVHVDYEIIKRVFVNIFTNAIKFSPAGGSIRIFAEGAEHDKVKIVVQDEGEGISPEYLSRVFDIFSREVPRDSGYSVSTGIGLAFCKMAVETHGGIIGVDSEPGRGSSFWFTLPYTGSQPALSGSAFDIAPEQQPDSEIRFTDNEKKYIADFCKNLESVSVSQLTEAKEIIRAVEGRSENINRWKLLLLQALAACNEQKYNELIRPYNDEPV